MGSDGSGTLDEAYRRLHVTGPEFAGWLSNHGPMAAEAMVRRGHAGAVHRWLDGYMRRLEEFPRGTGPIGADWQPALGDPRRVADWTVYFTREITEQPWREVLRTWWPRLLPGVVAAATHGVIRVGHAVRALNEDGEDADHLTELAHGLAYWAPGGSRYRARPQPIQPSPPQALRSVPPRRPRPPTSLRWCRGSQISRAASVIGSVGWARSRAGPPRWQRRTSQRRPASSGPG